LNCKLKASEEQPVSVYAKDFLANGKNSSIITYYLNNVEYTTTGRDQIAEQIPAIKGKFKTYQDFGQASFRDVFSEDELKNALKIRATNFSSSFIKNLGDGKFEIIPLPLQAQFSTVHAIVPDDYDNDGNQDILIGGNFYSPDFMTGRYDASIGLLLKGDGKGKFEPVPLQKSGIHFRGDVRSAVLIAVGNEKLLAVAANQGKLQFFKRNKR
jgi:hypothetical protein